MTKYEFLIKSLKNHTHQENNSFSYEKIPDKILAKDKIKIFCHEIDEENNEHGYFEKRCDMFLHGDGCPKCRTQMSNTKEWISKAQLKHQNLDGTPKYDYSKSKYNGSENEIIVICHEKDENGIEHGEWKPIARNHLFGTGCPRCSGNKKYNRIEYIKKAQLKHQNLDGTPKYDYSETYFNEKEFIGKQYINVICHEKDIFGLEHGEFIIRADTHLHKTGCPKCANSYKVSEKEFIFRSKEITNKIRKSKKLSEYDYSECNFTKMSNLIFPICNEKDINGNIHGKFEQIAYNHLLGKEGCPKCQALYKSFSEYKLQTYIASKLENIGIELHKRNIIPPYELDIYIPELKLAFEFNGLYYHNDKIVPNNYHLNKTELCEKQGIHLIHIWEDEWIEKQEIIKSRINNLLNINKNKIFARKCIIKEVPKLNEELFLEQNHLQGKCNSTYCYGLYYQNELVSLISFGIPRYNNSVNFELLRFCCKLNTTVIGGAQKLFKYFTNQFEHISIISYADRCWSFIDKNVYQNNLNMKLFNIQKNSYFYHKGQKRFRREQFMKHKLLDCPNNITEKEYMKNNGYNIIYTPGNIVFKYEK